MMSPHRKRLPTHQTQPVTTNSSPRVWYATLFLTVSSASAKPRGCQVNNKSQTLVALLDLRSGPSCKDVNLHGIQQLAVVQSTINQINAEFHSKNVTIKLQVFDTCSTAEGTRLATLKSLVASQQTCLETPFLLGFVGPEKHVDFIRPITKVFKAAHVIPYPASRTSTNSDSVFSVSSYPLQHHTQAVKTLIKGMGVKKLLVVHDQDDLSTMKLKELADALQNDVCFVEHLTIDSHSFSIVEHTNGESADAILIIVENPALLDHVANVLHKESGGLPNTVVVSVTKVGSVIWPRRPKQNVFVMQMHSLLNLNDLAINMDSSSLHEWAHQRVTACTMGNNTLNWCTSAYSMDVASRHQDWTLIPLHYGILLYASAVRITKAACPAGGGCQNVKWLSTLDEASLFVKPESGSQLSQRISFGMDLSAKFTIYSVQKNGNFLDVGHVEGGLMKLKSDYSFPPVTSEQNVTCPDQTTLTDRTQVTKVSLSTLEADFMDFLDRLQEAQGYQLIGVIAGACTVVLIIMVIGFYSVSGIVAARPKSRHGSSISSRNSTLSVGSL